MEIATMNTLNFADTKRRASGARSYAVKIAPSNGSSFTCGGQLQINFPSGLEGTYCDMDSVMIKMKVANGDAAIAAFDGHNGYSLFQNVSVLTAGQTLSQLNNYNVLMNALLDLNTSCDLANIDHFLSGAKSNGSRYRGETIAAAGSREICLPLALVGIAESSPRRMLPLFSSAGIQLRIDLEDAVNAFFSTAAGLANADITITDVEMICQFVELAPQVQAMVDNQVSGIYQLSVADYTHASSTLAAGVSSLTSTLGISRSSLERIFVTHRVSANIGNVQQFSLNNRSKANLTQYQFSNDGTMIPARPTKVSTSGAECMGALLVSDHGLKDVGKQTNFTNQVINGASSTVADGAYNLDSGTLGTPGTEATNEVGSFLMAQELEQQGSGGSDRIFAGISTMGSVLQFLGTYATTPAAMTVDFFAQSTIMLTMDRNQGAVWIASV